MPNLSQPSSTPSAFSLEEFFQAAKVQVRVIKALILREMITRFGRHNIGFLWMFVEPMMFSIGIAILWTYLGGHAKGVITAAGFALTGYSAIVVWRNCVSRTLSSIKANKALLYHRLVTIFDIAMSRALLEWAAVTVSFVTLTIIFTELGLMSLPADPLQAVMAWALLGWFVVVAGLIAVYLDERSEIFERVWHVAMYLTLPSQVLSRWSVGYRRQRKPYCSTPPWSMRLRCYARVTLDPVLMPSIRLAICSPVI